MLQKVCNARLVKKITAFLLAWLIVEAAGRYYGFAPSDIVYHYTWYPNFKERLEQTYGFDVLGNINPESFPVSDKAIPLLADQVVIEPLNQFILSRFVRSAEDELNKYPVGILAANLDHVYVLNQLNLSGVEARGTYDLNKKSIYLSNLFSKIIDKQAKEHILWRTFHHEFSSILIKKYPFDELGWRNTMGENFQYENDKDPTYLWMFHHNYIDPVDKKELYERGLLRQYAETGVENDFNIYAGVIFKEPDRMKQLITAYPAIARKYQFFREFYLSIDRGFSPIFDVIDSE